MERNLKDLKISIDNESLDIYFSNDLEDEPIHVCYWHISEVEEDPEVCISMLRAIQLYYTDPKKLVEILDKFHND